MKIILEVNKKKDCVCEFVKEIIGYLEKRDCEVFFFGDIKNNIEEIKKIDYVFSIGGDGTLLNTARKYARYKKNILGINFGNLGYLTGCDRKNVFIAIESLLSKNFYIERRIMLEWEKKLALNDICIGKYFHARLIRFDLFINNNFIESYRADGIIISTPTGSTAYNLSAGGPIIKPDLDIFALTPICAHSLYSRPLIVSSEDEIKIVIKNRLDGIKIIFDGQEILDCKKEILIKKAKFSANIIKFDKKGFYYVLRKKMI